MSETLYCVSLHFSFLNYVKHYLVKKICKRKKLIAEFANTLPKVAFIT